MYINNQINKIYQIYEGTAQIQRLIIANLPENLRDSLDYS